VSEAWMFLRRHTVGTVSTALATVLVGAAVAAPVLLSPTAGASVTQSPGLTPGKVLSGVVIRGGTSAANSFGAWRGAPVTAVVDYTGTDSWASITNVAGQGLTGYWAGETAHRVWSVPLIPSDGSSSLETAATGAYNSKYAKVAQDLIAGGDGNATIRLGWEMTGDWFAWSGVKDPAAFAGAFRQAVTAMRAVPGAHFTFDFNIAMGYVDPTPMYPGDAYVDIIGADNYDTSWAWNYPPSDHVQSWNQILTENWGLNWLSSFAAAHGKRMSMPEWGVSYRCDGHGGGDDPYFMDQLHNWFATHDVAYEAYFQVDDSSCNRFRLDSGLFNNAAKEYQKLWGGAAQTVTNPVTPPAAGSVVTPPPPAAPVAPVAPVVPKTGLLLSYRSDRSSPVALADATVARSAYIFYATTTPVSMVVFSLDGKPYRAETSAAFDLVGTSGNDAKPFLPSKLKAGKHTVSAMVTSTSGVKTKVSATFTVPVSAVKTLTTRFLRVSAAPKGRPTVRLDLALLRGTRYLIFPTVTGQAKATYKIDGKLIRTGEANAAGAIHVKTMSVAGLSKGLHHVVLRLVNKAGHVTTVLARFRVV
jgi:methionine-rich copper-binding protein CopC